MNNDTKSFPEYDSQDANVCISRMYEWTISHAEEQIDYYSGKAKYNKNLSIFIRGISVIFAGIGALLPLIDAATASNGSPLAWGQWGYVLLAISVGFYGFERTYGFSSGWIRFMQAHLELNRMSNTFRYEFSLLKNKPSNPIGAVESQPALEDKDELILALKSFCDKVDAVVIEETEAWVQEFQSRIAELEKRLKIETKKEKKTKPEPKGQTATAEKIKVKINTQIEYTKFKVYLDTTLKETLTEPTECIIFASHGNHQITVKSFVNDEIKKTETRDIEVKAGEPYLVTFDL